MAINKYARLVDSNTIEERDERSDVRLPDGRKCPVSRAPDWYPLEKEVIENKEAYTLNAASYAVIDGVLHMTYPNKVALSAEDRIALLESKLKDVESERAELQSQIDALSLGL